MAGDIKIMAHVCIFLQISTQQEKHVYSMPMNNTLQASSMDSLHIFKLGLLLGCNEEFMLFVYVQFPIWSLESKLQQTLCIVITKAKHGYKSGRKVETNKREKNRQTDWDVPPF